MRNENLGVSFVVIFGSAAAYASGMPVRRMPKDIDVVFGGSIHSQADAEAIARQWAKAHGHGLEDLPIDAHRGYVWDDTLTLPIPVGLTGSAIVLVGQTFLRVEWREVTTTSAIIRALGSDPEACARALAAYWLPVALPPTPEGEMPVAVFDGEQEIARPGTGWIDFQVVPGVGAGDLGPDSAYIGEGVDALRRALSHYCDWQWHDILVQFRQMHVSLRYIAGFLRRIALHDIPAEKQAAIIAGTSGANGFGCIRFERGAAGTAYAGLRWTLPQVVKVP